MSELAKIGHKKKPRGKKFYQDMVNRRKDRIEFNKKKKAKKPLSTPPQE